MNAKAETIGSSKTTDAGLLTLAALIVVAGVAAYYLLPNLASIWRGLIVTGGIVLACGAAWFTTPGKAIRDYLRETQFEATVYILGKDEGGRHTPFFQNYRPQFYFRTTDVTGIVKLKEGVEMIMPGDNAELEVELITPIAMEEKLRFAIREGGRTVGAGVVAKIIE
jgi:hypothetical protein